MPDFLKEALDAAPDLVQYVAGAWFVMCALVVGAVVKNRGLDGVQQWVRDLEREDLDSARRSIKTALDTSRTEPVSEELCNEFLSGSDRWRRAQRRVSARLGRIRRGKIALIISSACVLTAIGLGLSRYCDSAACSGVTIASIICCVWLLLEAGPLFWLAFARRPPGGAESPAPIDEPQDE